MQSICLSLMLLLSSVLLKAQNFSLQYYDLIHQADSLYQAKKFKASGYTFAAAFKASKNLGTSNDRYDAACSWALAGFPDSAFNNLNCLVTREGYGNYLHVTTDPDLNSLHQDKRWMPFIHQVQQNQAKVELKYNKPLVRKLDTVFTDDQSDRLKIDSVEKKYGSNSKEMDALWATMAKKDSINLIKVKAILDKYGWLGSDVVSPRGNMVLFLVIQHADKQTQEKYLPMMRKAVKNGKANSANLALLEDRVALEEGRKQIYGSQIGRDVKTGKYYVRPIEDEANVNTRRAAVGLEPLEVYCKQWGIAYKVPQSIAN